MKKLIILLIAAAAMSLFNKYNQRQSKSSHHPISSSTQHKMLPEPDNSKFRCDGRTHCSQMTSCEEAIFFIRNCPNTKMDGNGDGIPCEKQWCR